MLYDLGAAHEAYVLEEQLTVTGIVEKDVVKCRVRTKPRKESARL
jgi:hypothetical protein